MAKAALEAMNGINLFGEQGSSQSTIHVDPDAQYRNCIIFNTLLPKESSSKVREKLSSHFIFLSTLSLLPSTLLPLFPPSLLPFTLSPSLLLSSLPSLLPSLFFFLFSFSSLLSPFLSPLLSPSGDRHLSPHDNRLPSFLHR